MTDPFSTHAAEYDAWFDAHPHAYAAELEAIRELLPDAGVGVEVGVGSGRFAGPLGVRYGVEPAEAMRARAIERGVEVVEGRAEALPFDDESVDYVLMVTVLCFLDDPAKAYAEAFRILKPGGVLVVAELDGDTELVRMYDQYREQDIFYRSARFRSATNILSFIEQAGFQIQDIRQTIFGDPSALKAPDAVRQGFGEGAFVVVRALLPHHELSYESPTDGFEDD
jgi:ubiquinone/menaquinone biosynthesis C-methylase UbiE